MRTQTHVRFARVCCLCESDGQLVHFYTNVFSFIFTSCEYSIRAKETTDLKGVETAIMSLL